MVQKDNNLCVLPCPLLLSNDLTFAAFKLLGVIYAFYGKEKKPIRHTNEQIGRILGITTRHVTASIKLLVDKGMVISKQGRKRSLEPDMSFEWSFAEWDRVCKILSGEIALSDDEDSNVYPLKRVLPEVMEIIEYWNSKEKLLKVKIPNQLGNQWEMTPTFASLVTQIHTLLDGHLFDSFKSYRYYHGKPWTVEEVKQSIDNFYLAATSEDFYPQAKLPMFKKTLYIFLLNVYVTNPLWKSALITYVDPPKPFYFKVKEEEPKSIPMYWSIKEEVTRVWFAGGEMSKEQDMKVVVVSNRFSDWFTKWKKYLPSMPMSSQWAAYVVDAALEKIQGQGQSQYHPLDTMRRDWFWEYFTVFMQRKGLLSTYAVK